MKVILSTLNSKYIHSSLSIRYLKSYCNDLNYDIETLEFTINQRNDYITSLIFRKNPDIVAFSCYIWNIEDILNISERLKLINPNIKILLGGPEVSYDGEELLKKHKFIDFIIFGEGEETFREFLTKFNKLNEIKGLIYRSNDKVIKNEPRPLILNLDKIPSPFTSNNEDFKDKIVYYESSRGCPFNCQFCLSSTNKGVRFFSVERVKDDLLKLISLNVKQVKFVDRTFNANKNYAKEIMRYIIELNPKNTNFHFEVTAHLIDDDMLDFLRNVKEGLFQFEIGVQSTNEKTLISINRKTDFNKLSYVVKKIKSFKNIHQHLDLIAGLPYEDYKSFANSFDNVYNLRPEKIQLGFLKLLKGSRLRIDKEKYGFKFINKPPYEVLENNYISYEEMLKLKNIEDIVERYGVEMDFKVSIEYLIKIFKSPFILFENISYYWREKGYFNISHSKKNLYKILLEFYNEKIKENSYLFKELLKYDYLYNNNAALPSFIERYDVDKLNKERHDFLRDIKNINKYLPSYINKSPKYIINEICFEKFMFNILKFIESDYEELDNDEIIVLFRYNKDKLSFYNCNTFDVTSEFKAMEESNGNNK